MTAQHQIHASAKLVNFSEVVLYDKRDDCHLGWVSAISAWTGLEILGLGIDNTEVSMLQSGFCQSCSKHQAKLGGPLTSCSAESGLAKGPKLSAE